MVRTMSDELDLCLNRGNLFADVIRKQFPSIWAVASEALARTNALMHRVHDEQPRTDRQLIHLGLWGSIRRYQVNSILMAFARNLDESLAILRMATELSRTLRTISKNDAHYETWVKGKDRESASFRRDAKFDSSDATEKRILDAYRFCSDFGTHGHKTSAAYLEETPLGKEPSLEGIRIVSKYWFTSFDAMHRLALKICVDPCTERTRCHRLCPQRLLQPVLSLKALMTRSRESIVNSVVAVCKQSVITSVISSSTNLRC